MKIDQKAQKKQAAKRFWETHDYNPLLGKYYDPDRESFFSETKKALEDQSSKTWSKRLPPVVQGSYGSVYDLINHNAKDRNKKGDGNIFVGKMTRSIRRGQARAQRAITQERDVVAQRKIKANIMNIRKINRVSYNRFKSQEDRGFNIVDTRSYRGLKKAPLYRPRTSEKLSGWSRVNATRTATELQPTRRARTSVGRTRTRTARGVTNNNKSVPKLNMGAVHR